MLMQHPVQLWGGVECTLNRVGDQFFDQLSLNGHRDRLEADLDLFLGLGIRTLRTGVHWERYAATRSWSFPDQLLPAMSARNMRPIVGLLHHGSGPLGTSLLDPAFPTRLASFALQVARRYPEVDAYTPVNEPQTTGRFACLYGHWYPHHRSMTSYMRALCNQIKGIALAMRAIRTVNPNAQLIHTEDGGATYSTPELEPYRREREHRRWLGTDLLCGCVDRAHSLFYFLRFHGLSEAEILWFRDNPCPPSVLGLNYYVTSDRFLDHRLHLYPANLPGGDTGDEPLVDFEAVRIRREGITGVRNMLTEAWQRYHLPLAITEAHLGCHPDEQIRWLAEVWQQTTAARAAGADVRAVTAWSLLGAFNWCHLCTRDSGTYEPGVFLLDGGQPRPTPLAALVQNLANGLPPAHHALQRPGWWHRSDRFTVPPPAPDDLHALERPHLYPDPVQLAL